MTINKFCCLLLLLAIAEKAFTLDDIETAQPYSAPYIVSLKFQNYERDTPRHYCAAAILNENWIITSADCVSGFAIITIVAGEYDLSIDSGGEQFRKIGKKIKHEKYYSIIFGPYDIALIRVDKPFELNELIKPIALPSSDANITDTVTLYGWSSTTNETHPNVLQTTTRSLISLYECRGFHGHRIHETNFCMGPLDSKNKACVVDNGGPIVQINSGKIELIGISSWRSLICYPGPYVNVRITSFIDWINENINENIIENIIT